ncbi:MAG: BsuPI-related putative proteinase inhibitor [Anaerobacillus sp.]
MLKYITMGTMVLLLLSGCGEENTSMNVNSSTNESTGSSGIVAGSIEPSLSLEKKGNGKAIFQYTIQNQTEQVQSIHFPSSQKYDYKLYNKAGDTLQTYSADKSFVKEEEDVELKQAEVLEYTFTIDQLSPGPYTLEAWLATEGEGDYKTTIDFTID